MCKEKPINVGCDEEPIKVEVHKPYGVIITLRSDDKVKGNDRYMISVKDAIALSDELNKQAYSIINEVNAVPIVPSALKALIDLGKVSYMNYYKQIENDTTGFNLYRIKATFTDGSSREYYFECKFFQDKELRDMQMDYINHTPIYLNTKEDIDGIEFRNGRYGFNINPNKKNDNIDWY